MHEAVTTNPSMPSIDYADENLGVVLENDSNENGEDTANFASFD